MKQCKYPFFAAMVAITIMSGPLWAPRLGTPAARSVLLRPVLIATSGWLADSMIGTDATADVTLTLPGRNNLQPTPVSTIRARQRAG
jgi:hypothetical protein